MGLLSDSVGGQMVVITVRFLKAFHATWPDLTLWEKNYDFSRVLVLKLPSIYPCRNFMSKIQTLGPDAVVSTKPECLQVKMIVYHLFLPEVRANR